MSAPPLATGGHVARLAQVAKDERNPALAQLEPISHIPHTQAGLVLDRKQQPPVVREQ